MILTAAALMLAISPPADAAREWAVNRPNRGTHSRVVARASLPPHGWERFAACVVNRESHGQPHRTVVAMAVGHAPGAQRGRHGRRSEQAQQQTDGPLGVVLSQHQQWRCDTHTGHARMQENLAEDQRQQRARKHHQSRTVGSAADTMSMSIASSARVC
jgi:hypothetical protein